MSYLTDTVKTIKPHKARKMGYTQMTEWGKEKSEIQIPTKRRGVRAHIGINWPDWLRNEYERVLKKGNCAMILKKQILGVSYYAIFINEPLKDKTGEYINGTSRKILTPKMKPVY